MGADRAVHIKDDETDGSDALGVARLLAAVAKEENPDLILAGFMSDDGNFSAVPPMLAELVGIPHTTAAVKAEQTNGTLRCDREIEGGAHEVVELQTPCLVAVQTGINQVRYASLKGIMAAKKKPCDVKSVGDLGLSGQDMERARPSPDRITVHRLAERAREGLAAETSRIRHGGP